MFQVMSNMMKEAFEKHRHFYAHTLHAHLLLGCLCLCWPARTFCFHLLYTLQKVMENFGYARNMEEEGRGRKEEEAGCCAWHMALGMACCK